MKTGTPKHCQAGAKPAACHTHFAQPTYFLIFMYSCSLTVVIKRIRYVMTMDGSRSNVWGAWPLPFPPLPLPLAPLPHPPLRSRPLKYS